MPRIRPAWLLIVSTFCAGCLPSSCAREESRELFSADSLSRALASQIPIDTLVTVFDTASGNGRDKVDEPVRFEHPRTLLFNADGSLHISDAEQNEVVQLDQSGRELNRVDLEPLVGQNAIPYLVGAHSDSLFVFLAGLNRFVVLRESVIIEDFPIAAEDAAMQLRYAAAGKRHAWIKTTDPETGGRLARYTLQGERTKETPLTGAYWSHAGPLRMVGDTLLSVRGYQPMVVRMSPGGVIDSLRLNGFDSPMLARMRSHQLGLAYSPPLLISSVALSEGRYFVVNVRPGWLRVDVYDRTGQIEAILTEPTPSYDKSFYPTDIAVRRDRDHYLLAISVSRPVGSVRMYEWRQRH